METCVTGGGVSPHPITIYTHHFIRTTTILYVRTTSTTTLPGGQSVATCAHTTLSFYLYFSTFDQPGLTLFSFLLFPLNRFDIK